MRNADNTQKPQILKRNNPRDISEDKSKEWLMNRYGYCYVEKNYEGK